MPILTAELLYAPGPDTEFPGCWRVRALGGLEVYPGLGAGPAPERRNHRRAIVAAFYYEDKAAGADIAGSSRT